MNMLKKICIVSIFILLNSLDVYANEKFINTLINRNIVCGIASEEEETFISINSNDKNNQNNMLF